MHHRASSQQLGQDAAPACTLMQPRSAAHVSLGPSSPLFHLEAYWLVTPPSLMALKALPSTAQLCRVTWERVRLMWTKAEQSSEKETEPGTEVPPPSSPRQASRILVTPWPGLSCPRSREAQACASRLCPSLEARPVTRGQPTPPPLRPHPGPNPVLMSSVGAESQSAGSGFSG